MYCENTLICNAAPGDSRRESRSVHPVTFVSLTQRVTALPSRCSPSLTVEKVFDVTDRPRPDDDLRLMPPSIGAGMSRGMCEALYWLSASVLTMMSAPSERLVVSPAHERCGQSLVPNVRHNMVHPAFTGRPSP